MALIPAPQKTPLPFISNCIYFLLKVKAPLRISSQRRPCLYVLDNTPFNIICQSVFYFFVVSKKD